MTNKMYSKKSLTPEQIVQWADEWFKAIQFDVESHITSDSSMLQARKVSVVRTALGGSRDFSVISQRTPQGISVEITTGKWAQNLGAVGIGTLLTGGLSLVGSGMAAGWTKKIESDLWCFLNKKITQLEDNIESDVKKCPFCAEDIKKEAIICRYCKSNLEK